MATKKTAKPSNSVKSLKARALTAKQAKTVKGGFIVVQKNRLVNPPEPVSPGLANPPNPDFGIKR